MGILDKIRGIRNDGDKELLDGIAHSFAATSNQPSASDSEMRRGLDIDIHTIEDEGLTSVLDRLCEGIPYTTPVYDVEGKPLVAPVTDDKGKVTHMVPVTETHYYFMPWAPALRVAISKVFSARFIDEYDAETDKIKLRNEFAKIKRGMNRRDRQSFTPLINIILLFCETALDDAKGGRKMLALKVQRKDLQVGLSRTSGRRP
jgi:hypothetical protein